MNYRYLVFLKGLLLIENSKGAKWNIAEAWVCDENLDPLSVETTMVPLQLGSEIRVCVQPGKSSRDEKVVMQSIDRFAFSKGNRGINGVQKIISDKQLVKDAATVLACRPGDPICSFRTELMDHFFYPVRFNSTYDLAPRTNVIQASGQVSMEYSGVEDGERRMVRGTIHFTNRQLQSAGTFAGSDNIQLLNISIAEQKRPSSNSIDESEPVDDSSDSTDEIETVKGYWDDLPTWARGLCIAAGVVAFLVICCCICCFAGCLVRDLFRDEISLLKKKKNGKKVSDLEKDVEKPAIDRNQKQNRTDLTGQTIAYVSEETVHDSMSLTEDQFASPAPRNNRRAGRRASGAKQVENPPGNVLPPFSSPTPSGPKTRKTPKTPKPLRTSQTKNGTPSAPKRKGLPKENNDESPNTPRITAKAPQMNDPSGRRSANGRPARLNSSNHSDPLAGIKRRRARLNSSDHSGPLAGSIHTTKRPSQNGPPPVKHRPNLNSNNNNNPAAVRRANSLPIGHSEDVAPMTPPRSDRTMMAPPPPPGSEAAATASPNALVRRSTPKKHPPRGRHHTSLPTKKSPSQTFSPKRSTTSLPPRRGGPKKKQPGMSVSLHNSPTPTTPAESSRKLKKTKTKKGPPKKKAAVSLPPLEPEETWGDQLD